MLVSSNCAHIPNLGFLLDVIYNGENCLSIYLFIFEKFGCKHWDLFKEKALFLGRGGVNTIMRGVVEVVRVVRNHSNFTSIVLFFHFKQFFTRLPFELTPKVATAELRIHNCTVFRTVINLILIFRQLLIIKMQRKLLNLFSLKSSFHW